jgi:ABC-2 type transport system permease protein
MSRWWRATRAGARLEAALLLRSPLLLVFAVVQAVVFLVVVTLFGLTGSRAPTALIQLDHSPYADAFVRNLDRAHHSFDLRPMSAARAHSQLRSGELVAAITIPAEFTATIRSGATLAIPVDVDNVDVDLTDDIQRALPSAIAAFGRELHLPQLRLTVAETDLIDHDTGYVPYLTVSALALDAFVLAALLAASSVAREWETNTIKLWRLAPAPASAWFAGKLLVGAAAAMVATALTGLVVVFGYGVRPQSVLSCIATLAGCVAIGACCGGWLGMVVRRTAVILPLVFGLALPLYLDSGTLEPERFDGDVIWSIAHVSPVYYAVGLLERAWHGLRVTPEPSWLNAIALVAFAAVTATAALRSLRRARLR